MKTSRMLAWQGQILNTSTTRSNHWCQHDIKFRMSAWSCLNSSGGHCSRLWMCRETAAHKSNLWVQMVVKWKHKEPHRITQTCTRTSYIQQPCTLQVTTGSITAYWEKDAGHSKSSDWYASEMGGQNRLLLVPNISAWHLRTISSASSSSLELTCAVYAPVHCCVPSAPPGGA